MDKKINEDLKALKFILDKNRSYIVPVFITLVSVVLFLQFVIPQFGALLRVREEAAEISAKVEALKANLDILVNVDEENLDSQLAVLNSALPLNKDLIGILNAVYSTAQRTGVNLGSFSFALGDLSKSDNKDNFPVVKLSVPINAGTIAINNFAETISKTVPLSEIYLVRIGGVSSMINLSFYYKSMDTSNYSQNVRISSISQKGLTLINKLGQFGNASAFLEPTAPIATSSASQ